MAYNNSSSALGPYSAGGYYYPPYQVPYPQGYGNGAQQYIPAEQQVFPGYMGPMGYSTQQYYPPNYPPMVQLPFPRPGYYWATETMLVETPWGFVPQLYPVERPIPQPIQQERDVKALAESQGDKVAKVAEKVEVAVGSKDETAEQTDEDGDEMAGDYGASALLVINPLEHLYASVDEIKALTGSPILSKLAAPFYSSAVTAPEVPMTNHDAALQAFIDDWYSIDRYPGHSYRDYYLEQEDLDSADKFAWQAHARHFFPLDFLPDLDQYEHMTKDFPLEDSAARAFYLPCRVESLHKRHKLDWDLGIIEVTLLDSGKPVHCFLNLYSGFDKRKDVLPEHDFRYNKSMQELFDSKKEQVVAFDDSEVGIRIKILKKDL